MWEVGLVCLETCWADLRAGVRVGTMVGVTVEVAEVRLGVWMRIELRPEAVVMVVLETVRVGMVGVVVVAVSILVVNCSVVS